MGRSEVRVEHVWVRGRRGEMVNTGRARTEGEGPSDAAADSNRILRQDTGEWPTPFAGEGI